jgi:meiotic recombination protein SPO11
MQWIGLSNADTAEATCMNTTEGLMSLSKRDRRLASRLLIRAPFCEGGQEPSWRQEVQKMLILNVKTEIQMLECYEGGLGGWLLSQGFTNLGWENFSQ